MREINPAHITERRLRRRRVHSAGGAFGAATSCAGAPAKGLRCLGVGWLRATRLVPTWPALGQPVSASADSQGDRPVPPQHSPRLAPPGGPFPFRFQGSPSHYPGAPSAGLAVDALVRVTLQRCAVLAPRGRRRGLCLISAFLAEACNISVCAWYSDEVTLLRRLGAAARRGLLK